jgi:hypothetical protein
MPVLQLNFPTTINDSAQIGDAVFVFQNLSPIAGFSIDNATSAIFLGEIVRINNPNNILGNTAVFWWVFLPANSPHLAAWGNLNPATDYIMFQKHGRSTGVSGVLGYYAELEFRNNSDKKVELFGVGSEVFESSK